MTISTFVLLLCMGAWTDAPIACSCFDFQKQINIPQDTKIKYTCDQLRYARVIHYKYYQILVYHNNLIIMNYIDDRKEDGEYVHINKIYFMVVSPIYSKYF